MFLGMFWGMLRGMFLGMFHSTELLTKDERDVVGACIGLCIEVCIAGVKHATFHEFLTPN